MNIPSQGEGDTASDVSISTKVNSYIVAVRFGDTHAADRATQSEVTGLSSRPHLLDPCGQLVLFALARVGNTPNGTARIVGD